MALSPAHERSGLCRTRTPRTAPLEGAMRNWAGNYNYEAARVHFPGSVQEIQDILRGCRNVRALGTRHSFNGLGDCPEADVISLKRLDRILRFDRVGPAEWTATVEGGIT